MIHSRIFRTSSVACRACYYILISSLLTLTSCVSTTATEGTDASLKYATLLTLEQGDSCTIATVRNPWKKERNLARYVLVPSA